MSPAWSIVPTRDRSRRSAVADVAREAAGTRLLRNLARRHDRHRHAVRDRGDARRGRRRRFRSSRTRRPFPRHVRPGAGERAGVAGARCRRRSTARSRASAAVLTRRAPPATSRARTCSICSMGSASRPASISRSSAGGRTVHLGRARPRAHFEGGAGARGEKAYGKITPRSLLTTNLSCRVRKSSVTAAHASGRSTSSAWAAS